MIYSILEGKQAEQYKARKAKEREEEIDKVYRSAAHRNDRNVGFKTKRYDIITGKQTNTDFMSGYNKQDEKKMKNDKLNRNRAAKVFNREVQRRDKDSSGKIRRMETDEDGFLIDRDYHDFTKAVDATMRHVRRHPKQYAKKSTNESTIFSDIEII